MAKVYVLQARHRALDTDTSFKVFSGLLCGTPYNHAQLCLDLMFKGQYATVASMEAETPAQAYERSQNITHPWVEAPGVRRISPEGVRSTSVGDVLVFSQESSARLYVVSQHGFTEVTEQFCTGKADLPPELVPAAKGIVHVS